MKKKKAKVFFYFDDPKERIVNSYAGIGAVSNTGENFYGEFTDTAVKSHSHTVGGFTTIKGHTMEVAKGFVLWLNKFSHVELWTSDIIRQADYMNEFFQLGREYLDEGDSCLKHVDFNYGSVNDLFIRYGIDPHISKWAFVDKPDTEYTLDIFALRQADLIYGSYVKLVRNKPYYENK